MRREGNTMNTKTIDVPEDNIRAGDTVVIVVTDVGTQTDNGTMDYRVISATREVPLWDIGTPGTAAITCDEDGTKLARGVIGPDGMFACVTHDGAHIAHEGEWSQFTPDTTLTFDQVRAALEDTDAAENCLTAPEVKEQTHAIMNLINKTGHGQ
jgi:hypothetical protein